MSRIGKKPIAIPKGVTIKVDGNVVSQAEFLAGLAEKSKVS